MKTLAIFGGTFDPVHKGHVQSAQELKQRLQFDELRLLPCHIPPHRESPGCSSKHRLAMVRLAIENTDLLVDDREVQRDATSYSVETLEALRQEYGENISISWVMGTDAFVDLASWHRWRELLNLAHIIVMARPGEPLPVEGEVADLLAQRNVDETGQVEVLSSTAAGRICLQTLTPYPISATAIRAALKNNQSAESYLHPAVLHYIQSHQLYTQC